MKSLPPVTIKNCYCIPSSERVIRTFKLAKKDET